MAVRRRVAPQSNSSQEPVRHREKPIQRTIRIPPQARTEEAMIERKDVFLAAYVDAMCNVSLACNNCKIAQSTVYLWRKEDPEFKQRMEDLLEIRIDFYENALDKQAQKGNIAAIAFFLKCRAKSRGYIERTEITGPGGKPMQLTLSREELPDPALRSALARMAQDDPEFAKRLAAGVGNTEE